MQDKIVTLEMIELAKTYFIIREGCVNAEYIGPEGEYQKWYYAVHKEYKNKMCKEWRLRNLEHDKKRSKKFGCIHRFMDKLNALRQVSGLIEPCCCNCGTKDIRVLTINHINGDGHKERPDRVSRVYRHVRRGRTTSDLDVRCFNCNILYEYELGRRSLPLNWKELYGSGT